MCKVHRALPRATAGLGLLAGFVLAAKLGVGVPGPQLAGGFTTEGKITRLTPGGFTINAEQNIIFRVRYDEKTQVKLKDGSSGTGKDLRLGQVVQVDGDLAETGEILAQRIAVKEEPPGKGTSPR